MFTFTIECPKHFSFSKCLAFLDRGYDESVYRTSDTEVTRLLRVPHGDILFSVSENEEGQLLISVLYGDADSTTENIITEFVREWLDLDRDLAPLYDLVQASELAGFFSTYHGLRLTRIPDLFEAICWPVIGQQINLSFAYRLKRRLVEYCGEPVRFRNTEHFTFPTPQRVLEVPDDHFRSMQFSARKAAYLKETARRILSGSVSKELLSALPETSAVISTLCGIRGVGEWTANYAAMKCLGRTDCITYGDTGLQAAIRKIQGLDRKPTYEETKRFFEPYAGWESYVNIFLWRSLSA